MRKFGHELKLEGDINLSPYREKWIRDHTDEDTKEWLEKDARLFLHQSSSTPCLDVLNSCGGIYLEDLQGRRIMDFHGNNVHQVGFANPYVIDAIKSQLDILPFCTRRYTNIKIIELAEKLAQIAPGTLNKVLFAPGATSAVGIALKLARIATGKFKVVSMWDSFHGASLDAISVGGESTFSKGIGPLLPGVEHVLPVNNYRCILGECGRCGLKCVKYLENVLEKIGDVGAVILETIRNTDVQLPPADYFQEIRKLCDRHGALLILDETAISLGRTGRMFAFEHYDIVPDMVVIGKGLGGGILPMAALIAKEELDVAQRFSIGHYTHEKSPVGAAAALATIEFIQKENLLVHCNKMSGYMYRRLENLMKKHALIGDVRGMGLLFALEMVKDRNTKEPAREETEKIMYSCLEKGLSFKVSYGNIIVWSPPLIIRQEEIDLAIEILDNAIGKVNG
ncbi:aspartate aminotransferase family protein [Candidatus Formimonas warabiya]|uniref:Aspartate aminotransferase family protein n=1 Tax=Formimonas warabiya TaxID=1761012 RepID=A0A3G1KSI0_FORW1|nr:aspartate aminotransferase family protein [Candidatus Formimonas warabiya]ATW25418.1 aspartate aminotransferase family protein [Candidatus Formimonas warabiya]